MSRSDAITYPRTRGRPQQRTGIFEAVPTLTAGPPSVFGQSYLAIAALVAWCWSFALFPSPAHAQHDTLPVGSRMPDASVQLVDTEGTPHTVADLMGQDVTVFLFWSNQCPWVDRYDTRIQDLASRFQSNGVQFVLVNSNPTSEYPQESMEACTSRKADVGYPMPYVKDRNARLAKALGASRAPHAFVFNDDELVYTGAIDDSPASGDNVEAEYLREALDAVLAGREVPVSSTKPFGCSLKYARSGS